MKNIKSKIIFVILGITVCFFISIVFSKPQLPNPIRIGVRTSAYALGYNISPENANGFCGIFGQELEKALNNPIRLAKVKVIYDDIENEYLKAGFDRYDGLKNREIHIECGPNSVESGSLVNSGNQQFGEYIQFSQNVFYTTGIKLLLRKDLAQKLVDPSADNSSLQSLLSQVKIGVVERTTTSVKLGKLNINVAPYPTREAALEALKTDENSAYASDAVILRTLLEYGVDQQFDNQGVLIRRSRPPYNKEYTLYPDKAGEYLTSDPTEKYVIAIKKDTPYSNNLISTIDNILSDNSQIANARSNVSIFEDEGRLEPDRVDSPVVELPGGFKAAQSDFIVAVIFLVATLALLIILLLKKGEKRRENERESRIHINTRIDNRNTQRGETMTEGDTYNVGQAGAVGKYSRSDNNTFLQSEQRRTIAEAAAEIQQLIKQLEQSKPGATDFEKITYVNDETTPSFKRRVIGALQSGGEIAIEEFLDNAYINVGKAIVKGWINPE